MTMDATRTCPECHGKGIVPGQESDKDCPRCGGCGTVGARYRDTKWDTDAPLTTDDIDEIAALIEAGPTGDDLLFEEWACTTIPRLIRFIRLRLS